MLEAYYPILENDFEIFLTLVSFHQILCMHSLDSLTLFYCNSVRNLKCTQIEYGLKYILW